MNRWKVVFVSVLVALILTGGGGRFVAWWFAGVRSDRSAPDRARNNAPFIMSPDAVVEAMIELADVHEDDVVYDLGCGDGRILITASVLRGCRGVGFDIDPARIAESRINAQRHQVADRVSFEERDIFTVDLSRASVVMMYLLPQLQEDLIPQLQQMKPGSRIISHRFGLGDLHDLPPDKTVAVQVDENTRHSVHLWITPLKRTPPPTLVGEAMTGRLQDRGVHARHHRPWSVGR
jgi:SAM-dependent methyltransferase